MVTFSIYMARLWALTESSTGVLAIACQALVQHRGTRFSSAPNSPVGPCSTWSFSGRPVDVAPGMGQAGHGPLPVADAALSVLVAGGHFLNAYPLSIGV